ncbi:HAD family hydrolase [Sulfurospirillum sp. 1612]|uniref:HAD family hydrolase n=1 Tax=Sulfurospirillum sp. 1612 TaxID=3094835 RepID=UPI002F94A4CB
MTATTILFDLDGTLIDSTDAILESFHTSFKQCNFSSPDDTAIKSLIGHTLEDMYLQLGVPKEEHQRIIAAYKEHYRQISRAQTLLLPYAKEALEAAKTFATLGVVTTKTKRYSLELLEHLGILDYFTSIIGREDVQNPKPHPEPVLKAIAMLHAEKASTWMVGDTILDIQSANQAGIQSCAVLCGYGMREDLEQQTSHISQHSHDAVQLILRNSNLL